MKRAEAVEIVRERLAATFDMPRLMAEIEQLRSDHGVRTPAHQILTDALDRVVSAQDVLDDERRRALALHWTLRLLQELSDDQDLKTKRLALADYCKLAGLYDAGAARQAAKPDEPLPSSLKDKLRLINGGRA